MHRVFSVLPAFLLALPAFAADPPAFPSAEGFGAVTPGGRGGRVIKVTTLDDAGPGSLREACQAKEPRIILFDVAGYIELKSDIELNSPFCTIAGQSAPGDGVCLRGAGLVISTHDVIVRHLRVRLGARDPATIDHFRDCIHIAGAEPPARIILDHCSLTWTLSRNLVTWSGARDITVQWCIIAQPLFRPDGDGRKYSGMGFLVGDNTRNITIHHNLFAHNNQRNPRLKHGVRADVINNVVYNWNDSAASLMGDFEGHADAPAVEANLINNWYQEGGNTLAEVPIVRAITSARVYARGNLANHRWLDADLRKAVANLTLLDAPLPGAAVRRQSAKEAYGTVLDRAGAIRPKRDAADDRIVASVRASTGGYVADEKEAGGWPELAAATPRRDRDGDGLPDAWETTAGLNPDDASDAANPVGGEGAGSTALEKWLNELAGEG